VLSDRSRGEVHGHARVQKVETARSQRGADAVAGFEDRGVAEADHAERRQPARDVYLHLDVHRLHAADR
jgi:hypothetical protein